MNNPFQGDSTEDIYMYSVQPLPEFVLSGGRATVFAYGKRLEIAHYCIS